jgi:hypothetical protein
MTEKHNKRNTINLEDQIIGKLYTGKKFDATK